MSAKVACESANLWLVLGRGKKEKRKKEKHQSISQQVFTVLKSTCFKILLITACNSSVLGPLSASRLALLFPSIMRVGTNLITKVGYYGLVGCSICLVIYAAKSTNNDQLFSLEVGHYSDIQVLYMKKCYDEKVWKASSTLLEELIWLLSRSN